MGCGASQSGPIDSDKPSNPVPESQDENEAGASGNSDNLVQHGAATLKNEIEAITEGSEPTLTDERAKPEHFYHIFNLWPVVRPGVKEFFTKIAEEKEKGTVKRVFIYTANTSLHWVRFVMQCILKYNGLPLSLIDGIKHAPGGLKVVPENAVLYDDHPENAIGHCVQVDQYTNEIPWSILAPLISKLPDHGQDTCPCWDQCGGIKAFLDRDMAYKALCTFEIAEVFFFFMMGYKLHYDAPFMQVTHFDVTRLCMMMACSAQDRDHDPMSEQTLYELTESFVPYEEVQLFAAICSYLRHRTY